VKTESVQFWTAKPSNVFYPKLHIESPWNVYKWIVENFISFPKSLRSLCLDVWIFSCKFLKLLVWICPNLDRAVVLARFDLANCWIMLCWQYQSCREFPKISKKYLFTILGLIFEELWLKQAPVVLLFWFCYVWWMLYSIVFDSSRLFSRLMIGWIRSNDNITNTIGLNYISNKYTSRKVSEPN
jgi:hypothetical protein